MLATGKAKTVIWRWQERFGEEGGWAALPDGARLWLRTCQCGA
jgi:hypothetical protein